MKTAIIPLKVFAYMALTILVFATGCKEDPIHLNEKFDLNYKECNELAEGSQNLKICFIDLIEDSRCPEGAACIWAGRAVVKLKVNEKEMTLGIGDLRAGDSDYVSKGTYGPYSIELADVQFDVEAHRGMDKYYNVVLNIQ